MPGDKRLVSLCCTIKNRGDNLARLFRSLAACESDHNWEFVLADYESTDIGLKKLLAEQPFKTKLVTLSGGDFNRSQGLNAASQHVSGGTMDVIFFLDTDMLVPEDFFKQIRKHVQPGRTWFPICYSLHKGKPAVILRSSRFPRKANGWWRAEGKGMCGFVHGDFSALRGWDGRIGVTYGGEDGDIARRVKSHGFSMVRANCEGLFHVWHPTGNYRTKHHRIKTKPHTRQKKPNPVPTQPKITVWTPAE